MIVLITANFLSNSEMHSYSDDARQLRARLITEVRRHRRDTTVESLYTRYIYRGEKPKSAVFISVISWSEYR